MQPTDIRIEFDPSWILFQGSGVLVLNKPAGVPVNRGTSHEAGVVELLDEWVSLNPGVIETRSGKTLHPVLRLDRESSGALVVGLTKRSARNLQTALAESGVATRYVAVVAGPVDALGHLSGTVRSRHRGAYQQLGTELEFRRLAGDERLSLVEVQPFGGRTHHIRALFADAGRPLAGDLRYGKPKPSRQFLEKFAVPHFLLHAKEISLPESILGTSQTFAAPLPAPFLAVLEKKGWKL